MRFDFSGDKVLITGAGGGVGRVLVDLFASLGATVVACDNNTELLADLDTDLTYEFDLARIGNIKNVVKSICADGAPSVVISNAGWTRAETLQDVGSSLSAQEININLHGCIELTQALLPAMRDEKRGNFVFVSSINALSHFGNPVYSAAKAGVLAWMRAIATEEGHLGIRANAVAPGSINTKAWNQRIEKDPEIVERVNKLYPLRRMVTPEEVAQAVVFLASDWASGITGITMPVDAGITSGNLPFLEQLQ